MRLEDITDPMTDSLYGFHQRLYLMRVMGVIIYHKVFTAVKVNIKTPFNP
jgi:hypothetical protein